MQLQFTIGQNQFVEFFNVFFTWTAFSAIKKEFFINTRNSDSYIVLKITKVASLDN